LATKDPAPERIKQAARRHLKSARNTPLASIS
jgi:hypothetical protein